MNAGPEAVTVVRRHVIIGLLAVCVFAAGVFAWAATARIGGAVVVTGTVEVAQNRQVVAHVTGGVVAQIRVADGDMVSRGAILVRLDTAQARRDLAFSRAQLFDLQSQRDRLRSEGQGRDDVVLFLREPSPFGRDRYRRRCHA